MNWKKRIEELEKNRQIELKIVKDDELVNHVYDYVLSFYEKEEEVPTYQLQFGKFEVKK